MDAQTALRLPAALVAALIALLASAVQAAPLAGFYAGGWGAPPQFNYVQLDLVQAEGGGLKGTLAQPYLGPAKVDLDKVVVDGDRLRFQAEGAAYDLRRTDLGYAGAVVASGGRPQQVSLIHRPGSPKPDVLARYEGTYDLGGGRTLSLARNNATSGFWWLELPSGRTGFALNRSQTAFVAGECFYCGEPLRWRLEVVIGPSGAAEAIRYTERGRTRLAPRLRDVREEMVAFTAADGVKLEGTVFLPPGPGPHPGLVLVHGSGAQSRNAFYGQMRFLSEAYARTGIAVLAYDKRGVGGSAGDWEVAGLDTLAGDTVAAVAALRARRDIDTKRVGISGASQANWIVPMAARHIPDLALMQLRSGSSPMGVEESEWRRLVLQMKGEGFSQADIDAALKIRRMMDAYARTGQGWAELEAAFRPIEKTIWADRFLGGLPARDAPDWPWLKGAFGYDTTADFARYRGPLQVLYGGVDFVPTEQARPMLEAALGERVRDPDVSIAVWPGANHNYYAAASAADSIFPGLSRHVPGFYPCVTGWAAERFGLKRRGEATKTCPK